MARLTDKVVFITGAARGQGRSHAVRCAEEGADIIAVDICSDLPDVGYTRTTDADLEETVRLVEATGRKIVARKVDVRDYAALADAVETGVVTFGGRLDVVSANAGIGSTFSRNHMHNLPLSTWEEMIDINLSGVWHTVKATVPHMIAAGNGGCVVLTGSSAALRGFANIGHYVTAKHALLGMMKSMTLELGPLGIRVNSLHPCNVDSDMLHNSAVYKLFLPETENPTREEFAEKAKALTALRVPWVEPVDVSNALIFLASDEARYITGVALPVDAGTTLM